MTVVVTIPLASAIEVAERAAAFHRRRDPRDARTTTSSQG
jgi:hypothetical protein